MVQIFASVLHYFRQEDHTLESSDCKYWLIVILISDYMAGHNKQLATRLVRWEYIGNLKKTERSEWLSTWWSKGWTVTKTIWGDGQERQDSQLAQISLVPHRCYLHKVDNLGLLLFPTIVAFLMINTVFFGLQLEDYFSEFGLFGHREYFRLHRALIKHSTQKQVCSYNLQNLPTVCMSWLFAKFPKDTPQL